MIASDADRPLRGAVHAFFKDFFEDWVYRFGRWTLVTILICVLLTVFPLPIYSF